MLITPRPALFQSTSLLLRRLSYFCATLLLITTPASRAEIVHLRGGGLEREWNTFPEQARADEWTFEFDGSGPTDALTLYLGQEDVKARWAVELNSKHLGYLKVEEDKLYATFPIKPQPGKNQLRVFHKSGRDVDDIRVGPIHVHPTNAPRTSLRISLRENGQPTAGRITVVDQAGYLSPMTIQSNDRLAVRDGVVYTLDGEAEIPLAPGTYTVYAGRGFEYSLEEKTFHIDDRPQAHTFKLTREVDTRGLISCDTHVHTVTHSGHGDCTLTERMISLAGENIELAIATDHNKHIDYRAEMNRLGIDQFTAVTGNEYTTRTGHFNLFPLDPKAKPQTYIGPDWQKVMECVKASGATISILNHGEDIHANWRPFAPENHDRQKGISRKGYAYDFNAMEVLNSGATLNDPMLLIEDWFGLLRAGLNIAAIGCSDSHDVSNFIVGQGRTYIPIKDDAVHRININEACEQILAGKSMVSYGLLCQLKLDGNTAHVDVQAPSWLQANRLQLFANGHAVFEESFKPTNKVTKIIPLKQRTEGFYVAVAHGPGVTGLYWPAAKPYQRRGPNFTPYVLGVSQVVHLTDSSE